MITPIFETVYFLKWLPLFVQGYEKKFFYDQWPKLNFDLIPDLKRNIERNILFNYRATFTSFLGFLLAFYTLLDMYKGVSDLEMCMDYFELPEVVVKI